MQVYERASLAAVYNSIMLMIFGALIALLFGPIALTSPNTGGIATQIVSSQLTFALLALTSQIRLFSYDTLIRLREENGGLLILPWYLGKLFGGYVDILFAPISFVFGYYSFVQSRTSILHYWLLYVLLYLAVSGLANFCACIFTVRYYWLVAHPAVSDTSVKFRARTRIQLRALCSLCFGALAACLRHIITSSSDYPL
jgi:hypothetical protein